jgi:hypothetical protein
VYVERRKHNSEKALKDLQQSAALMEVLAEFRRDSLIALWRDLLERGPGWRKRARTGLAALEKQIPDVEVLGEMHALAKPAK